MTKKNKNKNKNKKKKKKKKKKRSPRTKTIVTVIVMTMTRMIANIPRLSLGLLFGTHWDSKGHTGAMMSFGKGAAMSLSKK